MQKCSGFGAFHKPRVAQDSQPLMTRGTRGNAWRLSRLVGLLAACGESDSAPGWTASSTAADASTEGRDAAPELPRDAGGETEDAGHSDSYKAVAAIVQSSCSYIRCHGGSVFGAALLFERDADFAKQLVNVPACQYDSMPRVTPFDPERSWLMIKLTANVRPRDDPYQDYIFFEPPPDWDPSKRSCRDETADGTPLFGQRMPATAPNMLSEADLQAFRSWILAGAPQ